MIIVAPERQLPTGVVQGIENLLVQEGVAPTTIARLDKDVLRRLPGAMQWAPFLSAHIRIAWPLSRTVHAGLPPIRTSVSSPRATPAIRRRFPGGNRRSPPGRAIGSSTMAREFAHGAEAVGQKIERSTGVGMRRLRLLHHHPDDLRLVETAFPPSRLGKLPRIPGRGAEGIR